MKNADINYNLICLDQMILMVFDTENSMKFIRTETNRKERITLFEN